MNDGIQLHRMVVQYVDGDMMIRSARTVMLLSFATQAIGFARTAVIAAFLGASLDVDAYNLGLVVPTFISTVIGGWLQISFVGRYVGLVGTGNDAAGAAYRSRMLLVIVSISLVAALLCTLQPIRLMRFFIPDAQHAIASSSADALGVAGWILIPIIIGDFFGLVLNCHGRFFAPAVAPLANAVVSVSALWFWPQIDLSALVWTLLLGSTTQLLVVVAVARSMQLDFSFRASPAKGEILATIAIALPLLPAVMLSNSAMAILQFRSAELGTGAVAVLGYASKLHAALSQIMVVGFSTVLLPHFATLWSRNQKGEIVAILRRLARASVLLCAYLGTGIYLFGPPAVSLLFRRGAFDAELVQRVAELWAILSLSLFPFALGTFIAKFCQALRQSALILLSSVISFVTIWSIALLGAKAGSLQIIALSTTAAFSATMIFWLVWLSRTIEAAAIWADIAKGVALAALVLAPALIVDLLIQQRAETLPFILNIVVRGGLFTLIAAGMVYLSGFWQWFLAKRISEPAQVPEVN